MLMGSQKLVILKGVSSLLTSLKPEEYKMCYFPSAYVTMLIFLLLHLKSTGSACNRLNKRGEI